LGGQSLFESLTERQADAKQSSVFGQYLLVHAIEDEDKDSLHGREDGEEHQEDIRDDGERKKEHQVPKDPRETNGNEDGQVNSEFFLLVSLI